MKKIIILTFAMITVMLALCSCECTHENISSITCTEPVKCLDCGKTMSEPLGHAKVSEATCTESGKCLICGSIVAESLNHPEISEATCTKPSKCLICDLVISKALGHTEGDWIIDKEASCAGTGSKHSVCLVCNDTVSTKKISALPHTPGEWIVTKEMTCESNGAKNLKCSACQQTIKTETIVCPGKHSEGEWVTVRESSCTVSGRQEYKCKVCNTAYNLRGINAPGHTAGEWVTVTESTCSEYGRKELMCAVCNEAYKLDRVELLDHTPGVPATCTTAETCTECGKVTTAELGHAKEITNIEKLSTGESKISTACTRCQNTFEETVKELSISVANTGVSQTISTSGNYVSKSYAASATGGYGKLQYKFEVYASTSSSPISYLTQDFSTSSSYTLSSMGFGFGYSGYLLKVTVKDEAGNQKECIYRI